MEKHLLRKVQLTQLEIAKEIRRVCDENGINYFLDSGTLLGAVRHKGFIPWDDDLDLGMLREDYEKFCEIAPEKLDPKYCLQTWRTDKNYPLPFGKVRKRNTVYVEGKSDQSTENGIYVDIFPYDKAPENMEERAKLRKQMCDLARMALMKNHYQPWYEDGKTNWKKRIGYIYYQIKAAFTTHDKIVEEYEKLVNSVTDDVTRYEQTGNIFLYYLPKAWYEKFELIDFEDDKFLCTSNADGYLTSLYGDYMQLPPESERENRHQIIELDFGEEE